MNPIACNYNLLATSPVIVHTQILAMIVMATVLDSDLDGVCDEFEVDGCSDFFAFNFNPYSTKMEILNI
ncbi:MAG: hypothetical protein CM15mP107_3960 [Bacteroidota bacterium]|nr:MAG: hypothetical protein CM15mP107_3960 [Bacteroidota bacterium]